MKNSFLVMALVLGTLSAKADFVAKVVGVDYSVKQVSLDDAGFVRIQMNDGSAVNKDLSKGETAKLVGLARSLATADIVKTERKFVCESEQFVQQIDQVLSVNVGGDSWLTVLAGQGCTFHEMTQPKDQGALKAAQNLESSLTTLARQASTK